jgi:hypothetical protein
MSYWVREVAGWVLVGLGLLSFLVVYEYCARRWIFEAGILTVVSVFVFRGGISLLKVAVAARLCQPTPPSSTPASKPISSTPRRALPVEEARGSVRS